MITLKQRATLCALEQFGLRLKNLSRQFDQLQAVALVAFRESDAQPVTTPLVRAPDPTVWHSGPPPHIGWWNASLCNNWDTWRWWDGARWSEHAEAGLRGVTAAHYAARPEQAAASDIKWRHYYPTNARVPRVAP